MEKTKFWNGRESKEHSNPTTITKEVAEDTLITGLLGWLILAGVIFAYDAAAIKTKKIETLSTAAWSAQRHPLKGLVTGAIWGAISWHLFCDRGVTPRIIGENYG